MKRPFVLLFPCLAAGVLLQKYTRIGPEFSTGLLVFMVIGLLLLWGRPTRLVWAALLMILTGMLVQQHADSLPARLEPRGYTKVRALVLEDLVERTWSWESEVKLLTAETAEGMLVINEQARLQLNKQGADKLPKAGEIIEIPWMTVAVSLTGRPLFEYEAYLRAQGNLYLVRANAFEILPEKPVSARVWLGELKNKVETFLEESLPETEGALLKSILFGNQGYLTEIMTQRFARSGTAHIVAVSGLHVGMVAFILEKLLSFFKMGKNHRFLVIMLLLIAYTALVGFPVSMIRAVALYMLVVLAYFLDRKYDSINGLLAVAFGLIIWNPYTLTTVSFQLSFGATLSILLFYPLIEEKLHRLPSWLRGLLAVTLAAQIGTLPITLYHFQQISLISPLANLLIVPILGVVLMLGLAAITLGLLHLALGFWLNQVTRWLLAYLYAMVSLSAGLPFSSITVEGTRPFYLFCYYGMLLAGYYIIQTKRTRQAEEGKFDELSEIIIGYREGTE